MFKSYLYVYQNYDGDSGIIIANSRKQAEKVYNKVYPKRKIVDVLNGSDTATLELFDILQKNMLYITDPA